MATPCDAYDSDASSRLSSPASATPSPPPEYRPRLAYPSPPRSQDSSQSGSPSPDAMMDPSANSDEPPRKRRRISERQPRTTAHLDLRSGQLSDDDELQLARVLDVLHKRQKIVVIAGAGISVSAGIPDFRSSTGLFNSLRSQHNLKGSGKDMFDASHVYKDASSTSSFHDMVRSMSKLTKAAKPTPFHHMLATLAQQDRLLRLYSQNVDGIDTALEPLATEIPLKKKEGGKWPKTVQLHGGLDKMVCSKCHDMSGFDADLFDGPVPPVCPNCEELNRVRKVAGKRSHGVGMLRPRMVLYNEHNPDDEAIGSVTRDDLRKRPDAVIVVGTTLKVPGVKRIVREMCATVRDRKDGVAIWINNDPEPTGKEFEDCWDIVVRGTCDQIATSAALRQWDQSDEPEEVSDERWAMSQKSHVEIVIKNETFKRPRDGLTPMCSPHRPVATPMTSQRSSEEPCVQDSFGTDVEDLAPPTPSKKPSSATAFDKMKETKAKPSVKTVKKAASKPGVTKARAAPRKAPAKKTAAAKPQLKINQTLKQTKSAVAPAAKGGKKANGPKSPPKKAITLNPIAPVDARNNPLSPNMFPDVRKSSAIKATDESEIGDVVHVANPIAA
ncbi:hypothetical protein MBLNU459_g7032t1 [Dothideomycetes sp. NU459]